MARSFKKSWCNMRFGLYAEMQTPLHKPHAELYRELLAQMEHADQAGFDFICGYEVYGGCTQLREFFEVRGQAYVLRVASKFMVTLAKLGLPQCQARLHTAIIRNIVLVMVALARTPLALDRPVVRRFRPTI